MRPKTAGNHVLAYLSLAIWLLAITSCTTIRSRELEDPAQLPPSQDITEIRASAPYILDTGDEVTIRVWGYGFDELQRTAIINNSGEIYFPLLGAVKLSGQSVPGARELVANGLKKYFVDPQVEFSTTASRQQIHVFGEVNSPGTFAFHRPLLMMEGLARAGWFNRDANRQKVLLIRRAQDKYNVFSVNSGDFFQDGAKVPAFFLQSGDIVYVMPSKIANVERFMQRLQNILQPLLTAEQMIILAPMIIDVIQGKRLYAPISIP